MLSNCRNKIYQLLLGMLVRAGNNCNMSMNQTNTSYTRSSSEFFWIVRNFTKYKAMMAVTSVDKAEVLVAQFARNSTQKNNSNNSQSGVVNYRFSL